MAAYVGKAGDSFHYADIVFVGLRTEALHLEATLSASKDHRPYIYVTNLGKVRDRDHAIDKVAEIVTRERNLIALKEGDGNG